MNKQLTWRHLKGLHQLYETGRTASRILDNSYVLHLFRKNIIHYKLGTKILQAGHGFEELYRKDHLESYNHYNKFLNENEIVQSQSRYPERDIRILLFVKENKEQLLRNRYSRKRFSADFFKDESSKYLDTHPGLEKAILKLLGIEQFPGNDPKHKEEMLVINCTNPKCIFLCENFDFLTQPWISRPSQVELWYAGGNNIAKLDHLPTIQFPIYYSCDWDYAGLCIYLRVKEKIPQIKLLFPEAIDKAKSVNVANHKSQWNRNTEFAGLPRAAFRPAEIGLIEKLINRNEWIEEESNDFLQLMIANEVD